MFIKLNQLPGIGRASKYNIYKQYYPLVVLLTTHIYAVFNINTKLKCKNHS